MLESVPITIIVGTILGFLSGLGVGGGTLLILWLTLVLGMEHSAARILNLLFFLPSALIASLFHWKQGKLNLQKVLPAILCGCISAAAFSLVSRRIETDMIRKFFGVLLLFTGIRELLYRPRNAK